VSLGILAINEAVDTGETAQILSALRSADVGLYGVTSECDDIYQQELTEAKQAKKVEGDNGSQWVRHWAKGGYHYYYNLATKQGSWQQPPGFIQNNTQLSKEEIQ
ncbi:hypothetical protein scyTo_0024755, partial [Scyliorhinus torazame]|nr:hypothetical protein [Scyliorhinus torazame]